MRRPGIEPGSPSWQPAIPKFAHQMRSILTTILAALFFKSLNDKKNTLRN